MSQHVTNRLILGSLIMAVGLLTGCGTASDGGIYKSVDAGEHWEQKTLINIVNKKVTTISAVDVSSLLMHPTDPAVIYIGTKANGMYVTFDGAEHWISTGLTSGSIPSIAMDLIATDTIYAAKDKTIMKTTDGGVTWDTVYTDVKNGTITAVVVDSFDNSRIYAATNSGAIIKSTDRGLNWNLRFQNDDGIQELLMASHDTRILYALTSKNELYKTTTGGEERPDIVLPKNSNPINSGWDKLNVDKVYDVAIDPSDPQIVYLVNNHGIQRSFDNAVSWNEVPTLIGLDDPQNITIRNITVTPSNPTVIYFTIGNSIHKSLDGGISWKVLENFPSARNLTGLVANYIDASTIYAGTAAPVEKKGLLKI